jgi:hypothetical protein
LRRKITEKEEKKGDGAGADVEHDDIKAAILEAAEEFKLTE